MLHRFFCYGRLLGKLDGGGLVQTSETKKAEQASDLASDLSGYGPDLSACCEYKRHGTIEKIGEGS